MASDGLSARILALVHTIRADAWDRYAAGLGGEAVALWGVADIIEREATVSRQYFPGADITSQNYASAYPGAAIRPDCVVLHTTEGRGWTDYGGGATSPHMTIWFDFAAGVPVGVRQHFPADMSSRALSRPAPKTDANRTNTMNVFQIELVGTSGWASPDNGNAPYHVPNLWPDAPDNALRYVAHVLAWLHQEWGVPLTPIADRFPSWRSAEPMSWSRWQAFTGICGHGHVPGQSHTDPGALNAGRLCELARIIAGGDTTSQEADMQLTEPIDGAAVGLPGARNVGDLLVLAARGGWDARNGVAVLRAELDAITKVLASTRPDVDLDAVRAAARAGAEEAIAAGVKVTGTLEVESK